MLTILPGTKALPCQLPYILLSLKNSVEVLHHVERRCCTESRSRIDCLSQQKSQWDWWFILF